MIAEKTGNSVFFKLSRKFGCKMTERSMVTLESEVCLYGGKRKEGRTD